MTKENNPDTHKLLEHLDVLVIEHNSKLQVFFKLPDLYRLFTSENFDDFATYKEDLEEMSRFAKRCYVKSLSRIARPHCQKMHRVLKKQFDSFIIIKGLYGVETRYYKIEDFNAIVDFIVQENLLVPTIKPLPVINMAEVDSYVLKVIE